MNLIYRFILFLATKILDLFSPFSAKLNHFLEGRKSEPEKLRKFRGSHSGPLAWFHVASLGEYEQARPVIGKLKMKRPELAIAVSFFSPSGFDHVVRKIQPNVDFITYLPLDRKSFAEQFIDVLMPQLTFFVKNDLWFHHIQALKNRQIPVYLISANLREHPSFFGIPGAFFRQNLVAMDWIFTQNEKSLQLLRSIGYTQASIAGDTRFDQVAATASSPKSLPDIKAWSAEQTTIVIGSAWEEDMDLLIPLINSRPKYKWIIAPHDLNTEVMDRWATRIQLESKKYSGWRSTDSNVVLFIDNIGMLSSLYQFARVAYVGGAFGKGLHNILEPLGFGVPVIFGKVIKASRFPEAEQSELEGCGFSVSDEKELFEQLERLEDLGFYEKAVFSARKWVKSNLGAADRIIEKLSL